jgi:cobyrinic acid a,c-diamide synthase
MVGLIKGKVVMQTKLAALGYREISGAEGNFLLGSGAAARGHEFHYSTFEPAGDLDLPYAYHTKGRQGAKPEGYTTANLVAGYTHAHFASNPEIAANWLKACQQYNKEQMTDVHNESIEKPQSRKEL